MSADSAPDPSIPQAFETIGEHYRLTKKLGEGAFGVVYEARHTLLGQEFAVKILKPELCEDENVRERFLDEARALIRFSHPNVVQLRHVGEHAGRLYLVMDLVKGEALNDVLRREGALGEDRSVDLMTQVLAGLEAAHAAGIVHRDLKPSNMVVDKSHDGSERIRVLDFGLSKLSAIDGMQGAHRSVTGAIIGTLAYMSPEQLSGEKEIDARSDIFAAGLILHEMIEGKHPYPGESGIVVAAKLLRESVPDIDPKKAAKLSDSTLSALRQSLERDRDARFSSAVAFGQALAGKGPPSDTSRVTTIQEAKEALARAEAQERKAARERGGASKKRAILLLSGLVLLVGAVGFFLANQKGDTPDPTTTGRTPDRPPARVPETPIVPTIPDPAPQVPTPSEVPTPPEQPEPPVQPEVTAPTSVDPTPALPETPAPPVEPETPTTPDPQPEEPSPAPETPTPGSAEATLAEAEALTAAGKWRRATATWQALLAADPGNLDRLRASAMTWLTDANAQARRGEVDAAITSLDGLVQWLTALYKQTYEPRSVRDPEGMRRPLGFVLTHRGEAQDERARWLRVQGHPQRANKALAAAEADLRLAWQFLERDGEHYWDFLLRRAEHRRLMGDWTKYIEDLALTTQIDSDLVPPRMWVAHFTGLRRAAERALLGRRPGPRRGGPAVKRPAVKRPRAQRDRADEIAKEALQIAKKGITWTRMRGDAFTRDQWIEAARVILVNDMALDAAVERTPLHGLMNWYVDQAAATPAPPWADPKLAESQLLSLQGGLALLEAKVMRGRGKVAEAARLDEAAKEMAERAVAMREAIGAAGGVRPSACAYLVLAYVLRENGEQDAALDALKRAVDAGRTNPD